MSLWDWIDHFPSPCVATIATTATPEGRTPGLSQLSQESQRFRARKPAMDYDREGLEERAAILEFDGGYSREAAERRAGLVMAAQRRYQ